MEKGCKSILEIDMLENGGMEKEMDMVCFIILMEVYMKVFGKIIKKKVLVYFISQIELILKDALKKIIKSMKKLF